MILLPYWLPSVRSGETYMDEKVDAAQKELGVFHGEVNVSKIVLVLILTGLSRNQKLNGNAVGINIQKRGLSFKVVEELSSIFQFDCIDDAISHSVL